MRIQRYIVLLMLSITGVHGAEWQQTLATSASLRTAGARVVSSDALALSGGQNALVTYWEAARGARDLDIYRCVDVVDPKFAPLRQTCWKVRTAEGRRAIED